MLARFAAAVVLSTSAVAQSPQWGIASSQVLGTVFWPSVMAVGDVNLDGRQDVVVSSGYVLLGLAGGGLSQLPGFPVGNSDRDISIGDLDGDGLPDLLMPTSLRKGVGNGTFVSLPTPPGFVGTVTHEACAIADVNADGINDIATAGMIWPVGVELYVALGTSGGSFQPVLAQQVVPTTSMSDGMSVVAGEATGDGIKDFVVCHDGTYDQVSLVLGSASGSVTVQPAMGRAYPYRVALADFTGDGVPDLIDARGTLFVGSGGGQFAAGGCVLPGGPQDLASLRAFDCDGDGRKDFAAIVNSGATVLVARNLGGVVFDTSCEVVVGGLNSSMDLEMGDVVGDPRPEVLVLRRDAASALRFIVLRNLATNCNQNLIDDAVETAMGFTSDCDANGVPDSCQPDCDNSGTPDMCQIAAQPALDLNHNWTLDSCEVVGTPFCFGDATGAACPCDPGQAGPIGGGCANSTGNGGRLRAVGNAQVSLDSVKMNVSGLDSTAPGLLFQGTVQQAGGIGSAFGDGLLCVNGSGTVTRLIIHPAVSGSIAFGRDVPGDPALSTAGAVPGAGATLHYQVWYRDAASFCTPFGFNLTNGVSVAWAP